ncbi:hypothetical protein SSX86_010824 [Deinandra increscens subsp. villosa]|uniref:Uncharacterized protein n=1 Tax=Deinandra increscens subsp. villosa TaxID=3103831 RepID=A0AAP0H3K1_9ASTR
MITDWKAKIEDRYGFFSVINSEAIPNFGLQIQQQQSDFKFCSSIVLHRSIPLVTALISDGHSLYLQVTSLDFVAGDIVWAKHKAPPFVPKQGPEKSAVKPAQEKGKAIVEVAKEVPLDPVAEKLRQQRPKLLPGSIQLATQQFGTPLNQSNMMLEEYKAAILQANEHFLADIGCVANALGDPSVTIAQVTPVVRIANLFQNNTCSVVNIFDSSERTVVLESFGMKTDS